MKKFTLLLLALGVSIGFIQAQAPTAGATNPEARDAGNVISIFSGAYTDVASTDFNPGWGQSTTQTTEDIDGNSTLKYTNFNYQGTVLGSTQDASSMEYLHIDMWTSDATDVKVFPISISTGERSVSMTITADQWVGYDIPLSDFTSQGLSMSDIHQFKFDGQGGVSPSTIFLDNIYFYKSAPVEGTDASLSDLLVDGGTVDGFAANTLTYAVELPEGTSVVPTVTATENDVNANAVVTPAAELPGTTSIVVTAQDGTTTSTYEIAFTVFVPDPAPTTGATDPEARDAGDVISIFSGVYTDVVNTDFNPSWGQSTVQTSEDIDGNATLKYANFNYQGTVLGSTQDASDMEYLHIDLWTSDATDVKVFPISASTGERSVSLTITADQWVSYDIPLSDFTSQGLSFSDIHQFKFDGQGGVSPSTIFLDNIYFYKSAPVEGTDASLSDLLVDGGTVDGFTANTLSYAVELPEGTSVVPTVTATENDVNANAVVTPAAELPGTTSIVVTAQDGTTTSTYEIAFTVFVPDPAPATGATDPIARDAGDVISIFSGAYTDVASTDFNPGWGQSTTQTTEDIDGNATLKYANFNYQGTVLGSTQDASSMEYLHIDLWTSDATDVKVFPISASTGERSVSLTITADQWVSYDIPLSDFTSQGLSMSDIHQFKFDGQGGVSPSTIFLDNIYFYKVPADPTADASLSDLLIGGVTVDGFDTNTLDYSVLLPEGTSVVPTVTVVETNVNANGVVTAAEAISGTTSIVVTAEDGETTVTYTVAFSIPSCISGATGNELTSEYTLIWADEFSASGAVCSENWFHQTQLPAGGGWYNGEEQHYTDRLDNSSVAEGILNLVAKKESFTDQEVTKAYTSARLNSKIAFTYGRVDVRAKLPSGDGTWPAIWMLGQNIDEPGGYWDNEFGNTAWPATGEIDIMEHWGNNPNVIHGSLHTTSSSGSTVNTGTTTIADVSTTFHVYSMIWDADQIQFLVDDVAYYTYSPALKTAETWPFDAPQYLLLNIAMGGTGGSIDPGFTESSLEVDYVRVYQKNGAVEPPPGDLGAIDFETVESGAGFAWNVFENDNNPALEVVANPDASGINTSSTVAKFTARVAGAPYAGVESGHGDVGPFTFDDTNTTVKIMVYKTVISDVGLKFAESNGEAQPEVKVANTKINEWEELTFNFAGSIGKGITGIIDQVIVFSDYDTRSQENIVYFDNITFAASNGGGGSAPTVAAPTPQVQAANVISIFSDAYTDVTGTDFNPGWGQSTIQSVIEVESNQTLKYENFNYQGTNLGSTQDLSQMDFMHIDMWTSDATDVSVFPISVGSGEKSAALTVVASEWQSYDIPLTDFTSQGLSMADIHQLKFDGQSGVSPSTIYLDNIYFYKIDATTDATLSDLLIDGATVSGFSAGTAAYDVELAFGTTAVPTITATTTSEAASVVVTATESLPGTTTVMVTAEDGTSTTTYTIAMTVRTEVSTDASLSALSVDGTSVSGFSAETLDYAVGLPEGTTLVPTVTAVVTDIAANIQITAATEIPGTTSIVVTAEDGVTTSTYTVAFAISETQILPIDFEGGSYSFVDFDGGTATVIANPQSSGTNTSTTVAQIVRDGGATWAGSKLELSDNIDFTTNNTFSMKVYSTQVDVPVLFKLEAAGGAGVEVQLNTTVANEWETLSFDFTGSASDTYNQLVFIFDFGNVGDGSANSTFLFDDVEFFDITGGLDQIDLDVDFESSTVFYELTDFGDASTILGEDPTDASNTVAITTKTTGAATWAGTTIGTDKGFASVIPFTESETILSMKVYSPAAGITVRLKAEDHNDVTLTAETEAVTTVADEWEVLTFDLSNVAEGTNPFNLTTNFDKVNVFFDFGNEGTGAVYYWDDVVFGESSIVDPEPDPVTSIDIDNKNFIHVYANQETLNIRSEEEMNGFKVEVYSLMGTKVLVKTISDKHEAISFNSQGIYVVRISNRINQTLQITKIIAN